MIDNQENICFHVCLETYIKDFAFEGLVWQVKGYQFTLHFYDSVLTNIQPMLLLSQDAQKFYFIKFHKRGFTQLSNSYSRHETFRNILHFGL